jgi:hypothetical protein
MISARDNIDSNHRHKHIQKQINIIHEHISIQTYIQKFIISTNTNMYHPQVRKHNHLLIAWSLGSIEVVSELGCHVVRRNLRSKVENEYI